MAARVARGETHGRAMRRLAPQVSYVARVTLYLAEVLLVVMVATLVFGRPSAVRVATEPTPETVESLRDERPRSKPMPLPQNFGHDTLKYAFSITATLEENHRRILALPEFAYSPVWLRCAVLSIILLLLATHSIAWLSVSNRAVRVGFAVLFLGAYASVAVPYAWGAFGVAWLVPWLVVWPLHVPVLLGLCAASKSGLARHGVPVYMDVVRPDAEEAHPDDPPADTKGLPETAPDAPVATSAAEP